jgi:lyso-ornithine lipid O-acyltransferase
MRAFLRFVAFVVASTAFTAWKALQERTVGEAGRYRFRAEAQQSGSRMLCRILGLHVTVRGQPPHRMPELVVCNHLGIMDPFVLASVFRVALVAKSEVNRWPVVGWVARRMGVIFVERGRPTRTGAFMEDVRRRLASGVPVLVFPEGTTTRGDRLLPFKTGAFASLGGEEGERCLPLFLEIVSVNGRAATSLEVREPATWAGSEDPFLKRLFKQMGLRRVDFAIHIGEIQEVRGRNRKEMAQAMQEAVGLLGAHVLESSSAHRGAVE